MRYRTLDVRIWCDRKFRALSPLQPSAQALFLYLLTNPNTTSIPGLYRAGAAAMAEELGWTIEDFMKTFEEIIAQDLVKADFNARVIFIKNVIKYNKPQSINVVKSWQYIWDEIPECELKTEAYLRLKGFIDGMGDAFQRAFIMSCGEPNTKLSFKTKAIQEQKQEPEQEKQISTLQEDIIRVANSKAQFPHEEIIALYHEILPMCRPVRVWNKTRQGYLKQRWSENTDRQSTEWWREYFMYVRKSKFLTGGVEQNDGRPPFVADLEFLIKIASFTNVIEGKYHEGCQL